MPIVIDQLVVELGLDPTKLNQGQRDALESFRKTREEATAFGKGIESQEGKLVNFFSTLKREVLTVAAILLGGRGIKETIGFVTTLDAATARSAKTMNMATRELSAWQGVFQQNGASAESATASLGGLTAEMNRFMLTGQASFLPVLNRLGIGLFDGNKQLKTAGQLMLELSDAVKGMDPARAAAFLNMIPGMNPETINLLLQGRGAIEKYLAAAKAAGGTTDESAASAMRYQRSIALLDRSMISLGRTLTVLVAPALVAVADSLTKLFSGWATKPGTPEAAKIEGEFNATRERKFGNSRGMLEWMRDNLSTSEEDRGKWQGIIDRWYGAGSGRGEVPAVAPGRSSALPSASDQEAYIRRSAAARGINPDVAVAVAKSEGLNGYVGDKGTSFGPFQLHYKNNIPGLSNAGLGDTFTRRTGLDARDPSTWQQQVDFALDEAKKGGWGPWHGWKGLPNAGLSWGPTGAAGAAHGGVVNNRGGSQTSSSVSIGAVNVYPPSGDADAIAGGIKPALERANLAASANYGQQ